VLGKILVRAVQIRIVAVGLDDPALEVIRHDGAWRTAKILERPNMRPEPVGGALR